jgi:hypothetical protein
MTQIAWLRSCLFSKLNRTVLVRVHAIMLAILLPQLNHKKKILGEVLMLDQQGIEGPAAQL